MNKYSDPKQPKTHACSAPPGTSFSTPVQFLSVTAWSASAPAVRARSSPAVLGSSAALPTATPSATTAGRWSGAGLGRSDPRQGGYRSVLVIKVISGFLLIPLYLTL